MSCEDFHTFSIEFRSDILFKKFIKYEGDYIVYSMLIGISGKTSI